MSDTNYAKLWVYTEDRSLQFQGLVGEGTINVTGGGGGWESVPRPQQHAATSWRGAAEAYTMEIPILLDVLGAPDDSQWDVEGRCRTIEKMCGQLVDDSAGEPPLLILNANGGIQNDVYNFPPLRWVISEPPTWGEQLRNSSGRRVRQAVSIKFMKYLAYDTITRNTLGAHSTKGHTTIARGGDTYTKIAARELKQYGGARWGNRLAQFNGARDGHAKPLPGSTVRLPTVAQVKQWQHTSRR